MLPSEPNDLKLYLRRIVSGEASVDVNDAQEIKSLSRSAGQVTRELAIRALCRVGDPEALEIARGYLAHTFRHYRAAAAFVLGEIGDESDVLRVKGLGDDSALAVRQEVDAAVAKLQRGRR